MRTKAAKTPKQKQVLRVRSARAVAAVVNFKKGGEGWETIHKPMTGEG
jgi:hypothetical protein